MIHRTHRILTLLGNRPVAGLVDNHAGYATRMGYGHTVIDSLHVWGPRQPTLFRYHAIWHHLLRQPEGSLLMVLDQFSVVYADHPMALVFEGLDSLVVAQANDDSLCNPSMLLLRNTPEVRERVRQLVKGVSDWATFLGPDVHAPEPVLLGRHFTPRPCAQPLENGITPNIQANWPGAHYHDQLAQVRPLVANDAPCWGLREHGWIAQGDYDFRGVLNLVEEARALRDGLLPPHRRLAAIQPVHDEALHLNPGARVAFVSLYTPNVASYGHVHERNLARYCQRHGYGYHLYRQVPDFVDAGIGGSWAKAHLMRRHLAEHDFLFWIDADVLAINQARSIDAVIEGREALVGTDHTAWPMKSGMVGVRNTPAMHALVAEVCERIERASDRSSVHADGGDQTYFTWAFEARGLITEAYVVDSLSLDASPIYATREHSLFVHFPAQFNPFRAASMETWDRWSLEHDQA